MSTIQTEPDARVLILERKKGYGQTNHYPTCEIGRLFAKIGPWRKADTILPADIERIEKIGFRIEYRTCL